MATTKTNGVRIGFKNSDGKSWNKTLSGLDPEGIPDAAKAKTFASNYGLIVNGDITSIDLIETTPVAID